MSTKKDDHKMDRFMLECARGEIKELKESLSKALDEVYDLNSAL
jgi:hypothetical protein